MVDVLVDSSAWIEFFRDAENPTGERVEVLLDEDRAVLCGMVELELLRGVRPQERRVLESVFGALPYLETERRDFAAAGQRLAELRREGVTIPATDGLIAALALRHDLALLTTDTHFDHFPDLARF